MMLNILTVDCEDWYHTRISQKYLKTNGPIHYENHIGANIKILLELLHSHNSSATFFMLGAIAEKFPELIEKIEKSGHKIGAHGYSHSNIFLKTKKEFEDELKRVTQLLNNLTVSPIKSFRAPNWSINNTCLWAIDILKEHGYQYDSSLMKGISKSPYSNRKKIIEIPRSGAKLLTIHIPFGGAFLRIYPFNVIFHLMKKINEDGLPFMLYIHPWEIDCGIPSIKTSPLDGLIQYHGISHNLIKIKKILKYFKFTSIENFFQQENLNENFLNKFYYLM